MLHFSINPSEKINDNMIINIKTNSCSENPKENGHFQTLLKSGKIYIESNQSNFCSYEIFIKNNDKFAYLRRDNLYYRSDKNYAEIIIDSTVINNTLTLELKRFHHDITSSSDIYTINLHTEIPEYKLPKNNKGYNKYFQ